MFCCPLSAQPAKVRIWYHVYDIFGEKARRAKKTHVGTGTGTQVKSLISLMNFAPFSQELDFSKAQKGVYVVYDGVPFSQELESVVLGLGPNLDDILCIMAVV